MARFSEHKLRPEEELGGFEPDAEQDETFLLERLPQYPGELGRYMPENAAGESGVQPNTDTQNVVPEEVPPVSTQDAPVEFEEVAPVVAQEPIIPPVVVAENETAEEAGQEERRKRSILPWLAAALVLFALAGAGGWWLLKNSTQTKPMLALKKDSLRVTTENGVAPEIIKDTAALARAYNDSLQSLAYNDSLKNIAAKSDSLKNIALAAATVNKSTEKTADVVKETPKINPDGTNPGLTMKPTANTSRTVREVRPKEPVLQRSENGLYMVQVYSSPSREDAEDWLARLRERNAGNAVVTSQKIRGQQWYRVRFGSYPTRTEAENAALKLGFAQSWIVQIR